MPQTTDTTHCTFRGLELICLSSISFGSIVGIDRKPGRKPSLHRKDRWLMAQRSPSGGPLRRRLLLRAGPPLAAAGLTAALLAGSGGNAAAATTPPPKR